MALVSAAPNVGHRPGPGDHLEMQLTLLTGFSGIFDTSAGFPFLDGVLLILGEWNLSISFMVKEER